MHGTVQPGSIIDVQRVTHVDTWRKSPFHVNFVLVRDELDGPQLLDILEWSHRVGLENSRVLTPRFLAWSSAFQPALYASIARSQVAGARHEMRMVPAVEEAIAPAEPHLLWLQSVAFLAAVTLSAAIVQGRWSRGTIESKFDRLWQASSAAGLADDRRQALREAVIQMAATSSEPLELLLAIRREFMTIVGEFCAGMPCTSVKISSAANIDRMRFGFIDELVEQLPGVAAAIAYGSSVSSSDYADIDMVLVVDDSNATLRTLENCRPTWRDKELNIGVYDRDELWRMQLLSGDNLADYGLCIFGEVSLPHKSRAALLARNFSFGIVRQRQQLGMAAAAAGPIPERADDRLNLYQYFVKIPANVAKGTLGAAGIRLPKEDVADWLLDRIGFDTATEQQLARSQGPAMPLARAAIATGNVLAELNDQFRIVECVEAKHESA